MGPNATTSIVEESSKSIYVPHRRHHRPADAYCFQTKDTFVKLAKVTSILKKVPVPNIKKVSRGCCCSSLCVGMVLLCTAL